MIPAAILCVVLSAGSCRYFWISADGLETRASVEALMRAAEAAGANGVIVQVAGRGEAWYSSDELPEARVTADFDPLALVISEASRCGMEVHAWVNAFLTWSAPFEPGDRRHVWHAHPEWFMEDATGRSTRSYTREECESAGIVGATLSPAVPEVRERLARICCEITARYDVDGIHLDYIRYPGAAFGFEAAARDGFFLETGADPPGLPSARRFAGSTGSSGEWRDFRAGLVTESVRCVRAALRSSSPGILLSAAVIADPRTALEDYGCDWAAWLDEGLVDFVCPMAYTTSRTRAGELARLGAAAGGDRVVHGIAVFNQTLADALPGASEALSAGAGGVCVYSLNTFDPAQSAVLAGFWGSGSPVHPPDAAVLHRLARWLP